MCALPAAGAASRLWTAVHTRGTRGATASVGGTARLLLVVQRGFLLARFARDGARRGGDADRLTPIDIVVDPLRRLLAPLSLASLLGLVLGLALELLGPLVGAESRHGPFLYQAISGESTAHPQGLTRRGTRASAIPCLRRNEIGRASCRERV